jgi:hypothetical protein
MEHLPVEQRQGRLDSAPGFGASTRGTLKESTAAGRRAWPARGTASPRSRFPGVQR